MRANQELLRRVLLIAGMLLAGGVAAQPVKTIALVTVKPISTGWGPVGEHPGLILAVGTILRETAARVDGVDLLPWKETSGFKGLVSSGLYQFQAEDRYRGWQELVRADAYVEIAFPQDGAFAYQVHTAAGSKQGGLDRALKRPKQAVAAVVTTVFDALGVELSQELQAELADPETSKPVLFNTWSRWLDYLPNRYNDKPWDDPNSHASTIVIGDPKFVRGLSWALPMKLKKVFIRSNRAGAKGTANAAMFDLNVLRVLDSRFAYRVVPSYNQRLREDPHLLADSLKILHVAGSSIDMDLDDLDDVGGLAGGGGPKPAPDVKTTPLIRSHVCTALAGIKKPKVIDRLSLALADDPEEIVRAAAAASLGKFGGQALIVRHLEAAFKDKSSAVRRVVVETLAQLEQFKSPVFGQALKDSDPEVKWLAKSTLMDKAPDAASARALLLGVLAGPEARLRTFALQKAPGLFKEADKVEAAIARGIVADDADEQLEAVRLVRHYRLAGLAKRVGAQLAAASPEVRAAAAETLLELDAARIDEVVDSLGRDDSLAVQVVLAAGLAQHGAKRHLGTVKRLLKTADDKVRQHACNAVYNLYADDREQMVRAMLVDPSLRTGMAALRLIGKLGKKALLDDLVWAVGEHPNEYIRAGALDVLDKLDDGRCRETALAGLRSPYFIVRLFAADVLERRAVAGDAAAIEQASQRATNPWLAMALQDALANCRGEPKRGRVRLNLGKLEHTEGGELPNGWQLWLGDMPRDPAEARKLVDKGHRFGKVISAPPDQTTWGMRSWNNSKGRRSTYLLHLLKQVDAFDEIAENLYYCCLFDEPHSTGGGDGADLKRAFLLELGRPDLIAAGRQQDWRVAAPELAPYWRRFSAVTVAELSNWIVRIVRLTLQRKYPDLRLFPQTMSYMGGATMDAFEMLDCDGDYSWRYDYNNYFGHYRRGAVMRAIHPGMPAAMVTWMGWRSPSRFSLDAIYTTTKFPDEPWRLRGYMGTRAGLALYASGIEPSYFNHVSYKSMATRGRSTGGQRVYPLTPWSKALAERIRMMIKGDKEFYWDKVHDRIEAEIRKKYHPEDTEPGGGGVARKAPVEDPDLFDLEDTQGNMEKEIEAAYDVEVNKHFVNTMRGCSWMNIFNTDNSRAMANLPLPDRSPRDTLLVLSRGAKGFGDRPYFVMPAVAVVAGFDMAPTYQSVSLVDFAPYDTIMILDARDGVTNDLVRQTNEWLQKKRGLLYVCGDLNSKTALLPKMRFEKLTDRFLWEGDVAAAAKPTVKRKFKGRRGKKYTLQVPIEMGGFARNGDQVEDPETSIRFTYSGKIKPLLTHQGEAVLALWQDPERAKGLVLFDGAAEAGPVYTEALEAAILELDRERGAKIERNRWWGHVVWENEQFAIDVATSGYRTLQAARPRQHRGIDIINGDVNPLVKHGQSALILKNYVGPYAGGLGDWAVMARSELKEMQLLTPTKLRVLARGVVRVSHIGPEPIALEQAADFEEVPDQLEVWKAMWEGKKAFSRNELPGGRELHFASPDPVTVIAGQ